MALPLNELFSCSTKEGFVAVVTGGGSGIGLMIARALESNGATVYIVGRRKDILEQVAKENAKHGKLIPLQCDVTSRSSLESLVSTIESQSGYVNLLINNAGMVRPNFSYPVPTQSSDVKIFRKHVLETTSEAFQDTLHVNHTATYFATVAFLQLLDKGNKRGGLPGVSSQIINNASVGAFARDIPEVEYTLSKVAVMHLTKIMASMLAEYNIRCNAICPGIYPSGITTGLPLELPADQVPLLRQGHENDMAGLTLYLASTAGAYTTGSVFVSDGGLIMVHASTY